MDAIGFLTVMLLTLGFFLILAGIFTAYFGSGKSRIIGIVLLVVGILIGLIWGGMDYLYPDILNINMVDIIWVAFINIIAAMIGALIAIGVFLLAIMKS